LFRCAAFTHVDIGPPDTLAQILIIAVTVIVVAVPEGLPLAVTLALAFATRRMAKMNLLVRVLGSCETMANATVICTDKTGTLTQNKMSVVAGSVGVHLKFADRLAENANRSNANDDVDTEKPKSPVQPAPRRGRKDFSLDITEMNRALSAPLQKLFNDAIAINTTAFEGPDEKGTLTFIGSKTETALLQFAKDMGWADYRAIRNTAQVVQMFPFSSERKAMGVAVRAPDGKGVRLYLKGASEILSKLATQHIHVGNPSSQSYTEADATVDENAPIRVVDFDEETRNNISRTIIFYANQSLRTIALCYKDFPVWPPPGVEIDEEGNAPYDVLAKNLTLLAITAIEDPLRPNVTESVHTCLNAGVAVKMCTGDNVLTARCVAFCSGHNTLILTSRADPSRPSAVSTRPAVSSWKAPSSASSARRRWLRSFRACRCARPSTKRLAQKSLTSCTQVLARSSPLDKELLVSHLKAQGEVVGVTGDGMNDAPALKKANVGFSMGIAGTEVAKEASDIILMDDNFASIVSAIMWGRAVNDGVKKFLQVRRLSIGSLRCGCQTIPSFKSRSTSPPSCSPSSPPSLPKRSLPS
jgi:Ca2+-transporting ATPase